MKMQLLIGIVVLSLALVNGKSYHGYEQPDYVLEKNQPKDESFEVRRYFAANWTSTSVKGKEMQSSKAFMRLFDYINGDNKEKTKIPMTVPVTIKFSASSCLFCENTYVMSFYVPKAFQLNPPTPNSVQVTSELRKEFVAYVKTFSGYAHEKEYFQKATELYTDLQRHGVTVKMLETDMMYGASYDSPMHFFARKNEVWILAARK